MRKGAVDVLSAGGVSAYGGPSPRTAAEGDHAVAVLNTTVDELEELGPETATAEMVVATAVKFTEDAADRLDEALENAHRLIYADRSLRGTAERTILASVTVTEEDEWLEGALSYAVRFRL